MPKELVSGNQAHRCSSDTDDLNYPRIFASNPVMHCRRALWVFLAPCEPRHDKSSQDHQNSFQWPHLLNKNATIYARSKAIPTLPFYHPTPCTYNNISCRQDQGHEIQAKIHNVLYILCMSESLSCLELLHLCPYITPRLSSRSSSQHRSKHFSGISPGPQFSGS